MVRKSSIGNTKKLKRRTIDPRVPADKRRRMLVAYIESEAASMARFLGFPDSKIQMMFFQDGAPIILFGDLGPDTLQRKSS